jgi:DNA-binding NarL/FixJ family response regulator
VAHCKILIVDDHQSFRQFTRSQVEPEFQVVGEASDGLEALQKANELQPDLVLLDIGLPQVNGLETAKRLRISVPDAKILFLSVESDPDVIQEALKLGKGYVHKARAQRDLRAAVKAVLEGKQFISPDLEIRGGTDAEARISHEIVFCSDEATLLNRLTRFIATALRAGNPAIVWTTESHRENLLERLRLKGVDIDAAIQQGMYVASDASETPDAGSILDAIRRLNEAALKRGKKHPRAAVCGERAGRMWAEGKTDAAIRLERLVNELARSHDMDILCVYPAPQGQQDSSAFQNLCAEHTAVYSA